MASPDLFVPPLVKALKDALISTVQFFADLALRKYGTKAVPDSHKACWMIQIHLFAPTQPKPSKKLIPKPPRKLV